MTRFQALVMDRLQGLDKQERQELAEKLRDLRPSRERMNRNLASARKHADAIRGSAARIRPLR